MRTSGLATVLGVLLIGVGCNALVGNQEQMLAAGGGSAVGGGGGAGTGGGGAGTGGGGAGGVGTGGSAGIRDAGVPETGPTVWHFTATCDSCLSRKCGWDAGEDYAACKALPQCFAMIAQFSDCSSRGFSRSCFDELGSGTGSVEANFLADCTINQCLHECEPGEGGVPEGGLSDGP
jgi:hypothetical protein